MRSHSSIRQYNWENVLYKEKMRDEIKTVGVFIRQIAVRDRALL